MLEPGPLAGRERREAELVDWRKMLGPTPTDSDGERGQRGAGVRHMHPGETLDRRRPGGLSKPERRARLEGREVEGGEPRR
ncbi:hypothetical protein NDU88_002228 [Pleurodeles waltl]|uniref:Uncharacterized protein n=1 Tax=Pleurodeles waltl TaxID=8319 RepID=A0AAV7UA55_PLEWA|nr:hypothetical protein NDU88_002228 [Pleurodeles waltl]